MLAFLVMVLRRDFDGRGALGDGPSPEGLAWATVGVALGSGAAGG